MKRQALIAIALMGCVHQQSVTTQEACAAQGMVLEGVTLSAGGVGDLSTYGTSLHCRAPTDEHEACLVRARRDVLQVKLGFSTGWRNVVTGVGYLALILPGLVATLIFSVQESDNRRDVNDAEIAGAARCHE